MKIRTGFVSNSSSASFIVHWRVRTMGQKILLKEALCKLYGITSYDRGNNKVNWNDKWDKDVQPKFEQTEKMTQDNKDGTYTTVFFTSMMNSADDFGDTAKSMVLNLMTNEDFTIIDTKVNSDNW